MKKILMKMLLPAVFIGMAGLLLTSGCKCCNKKYENTSGGPFTVYASPVTGSGSNSACQFAYVGCATYSTNNVGWKPIAGVTHAAADGGGRTDTVVYYLGRFGDTGCNQTSVTVPTPAPSPYYQFVIYFPSNMPATNYPIILTGFNP